MYMVDATKCVSVSVTAPTVTVTLIDVYITRDGYKTSTIYKTEGAGRYSICYSVSVAGSTYVSASITIRAGKDQNSLKLVTGYSQVLYSQTYMVKLSDLGYSTVDDFLNAIGATDSCVICVTITYG